MGRGAAIALAAYFTSAALIGGYLGKNIYYAFNGPGAQTSLANRREIRAAIHQSYKDIKFHLEQANRDRYLRDYHFDIIKKKEQAITILKQKLKSTKPCLIERCTLIPEEWFTGGLLGLVMALGLLAGQQGYDIGTDMANSDDGDNWSRTSGEYPTGMG